MEISSLPETLIDEILALLPTKSAAATSLLSRSWRHRWRSIPNLDLSHLPHSQILTIINLHSGPIRLFKAYSDDSAVLSALSLRFSSSLLSLDLSDFAAGLNLPSIASDFPNLRHLRLSFCSVRSNFTSSPNFPFLQTLHLEGVRFSSVSGPLHLSTLIPSCRSLESLTLIDLILFEGDLCCDLFACEFPKLEHLKLSYCDLEFLPPDSGAKLPALRTLYLDSVEFHGRISGVFEACPGLERMSLMYVGSDRLQFVDVEASNLRGIEFVEVMHLKGFVVTSAPLLERVVMDCRVCVGGDGGESSGECNLLKLLGGVNSLKKLKLGNGVFEFLRSGNIPEGLPISFIHMRLMSLAVDFGDEKELLVLLCLVRSTPNLQVLKFKGSVYNREVLRDGQEFWEAQKGIDLFDKLKTLKMTEIMGVEAELDFIKFVLSKAKVLQKMVISFHGFISDKEIVMENILKFSMVSNQVKILFT